MPITTTGRATDFITFSRASNATVTGADGKIKWAGHNLLTNSESFDNALWEKTNVTVTANYAAAPNGTVTADRAVYAGGAGTPATRQLRQPISVNTSGITFTFGIWVSGTGKFRVQNVHGGVTATYSNDITATATPTLYTLTVTNAANAGTGFQVGGICAATTDDAFDLNVWGAHLYRSDLGGMVANPARGDAYYPTTPRNLLGYTEDFSNAAWQKLDSTVVAETNVIAPNGLPVADRLTAPTAINIPQSFTSVANTKRVFSCYLKQSGSASSCELYIFNPSASAFVSRASFNFSTGVATNITGTGATMTSVGNGWYRCSVEGASANTTNTHGIYNASEVYAWGAQLSDSASLDAYSPVYGAAVTSAAYYAPRLDYDANGSALGLLVEEQRTNVLLHTAAFDNAAWDKVAVGTASAPVVTANNATAPDGTLTADLVVFDRGAGTSGDRSVLSQAPSLSAGTYTQSVWLKAATAGDIGKQLALRNVAGGTYLVVTLTASWVRYERTEVWAVNNWEIANRQGITADTTVSAHVWGAQLEAGSFATSYIPNGSAVAGATRTADVASVSTQAFPYSATEGTVVVGWMPGNISSNSARLWYLDNSSGTAYQYVMAARQGDGTTASLGFEFSVRDNSVNQVGIATTTPTLAVGSTYKAASVYKVNDFAACMNGGTVGTDTSGTVPSGIDVLRIANHRDPTYLNGHIRQITYIPRRLSNSELQARTV